MNSSLVFPVEICSCDSVTAARTVWILLLLGFLRDLIEMAQRTGRSQKEVTRVRTARKVEIKSGSTQTNLTNKQTHVEDPGILLRRGAESACSMALNIETGSRMML